MADFQLKIANEVAHSDPSINFATKKVSMVSLTVNLDAPREFSFTQIGRAQWDGEFYPGQGVILYDSDSTADDTTVIFRGEIVKREAQGDSGGMRVDYTAMGPRYLASAYVMVSNKNQDTERPASNPASESAPHITYNAKRGDVDYDPSREWLTVGEIIKDLFKNNRQALSDCGAVAISDENAQFVQDELDMMTTAPPEPIVFSNTPFSEALVQILEWEPDIVMFVDPSTRKWHFRSVDTSKTDTSLGMYDVDVTLSDPGTYQVLTDSIKESTDDCATRLMIHGGLKTASTVFLLNDAGVPATGTEYRLKKGWEIDLEEGWTIQDAWARPTLHGGGDLTFYPTTTGGDTTVTWNGSQTTVTIDGASFADNFWRHGWIEFKAGNSAGTLSERIEHRRITGNDNDDEITYTPPMLFDATEVKAVRLINPVSQKWFVWRRFEIWKYVDDAYTEKIRVANISDQWMAVVGGQYMTNVVPTLQAIHNIDPDDTDVPMRINGALELIDGGEGFLASFPLCSLVMSPESLYDSTSTIGAPDEVILTAPRVTGNLTAVYPPDTVVAPPGTNVPDYEGTADSRFSIRKTRHEYLPDWKNDQQQVLFDNLAKAKLSPFKDVRLQGSVDLIDFQSGFAMRNVVSSSASRPRTLTIEVNENMAPSQSPGSLATTTNWDNMLVKSITYSWQKTGSPAVTTSLNIDNNQRPGRQQDELMFAVKNASTFIELRYDFNSTRSTIGQMSIAVDQRIMNPDLVR